MSELDPLCVKCHLPIVDGTVYYAAASVAVTEGITKAGSHCWSCSRTVSDALREKLKQLTAQRIQ